MVGICLTVVGPICGVLWYMMKRWVERIDDSLTSLREEVVQNRMTFQSDTAVLRERWATEQGACRLKNAELYATKTELNGAVNRLEHQQERR